MPEATFIRHQLSSEDMYKCTSYVDVDGEEIAVDWVTSQVIVNTKQELFDYLCNEAIKKYNQTRQ
jgi:hypothetical protein